MHLNKQHGTSYPDPNIHLSWHSLIYPRATNILEVGTSTQSIFKQLINHSTRELNKHVHQLIHVKLNQMHVHVTMHDLSHLLYFIIEPMHQCMFICMSIVFIKQKSPMMHPKQRKIKTCYTIDLGPKHVRSKLNGN